MEFVRSLRLVVSFFATDREAAPKVKKKEEIILFKFLHLCKSKKHFYTYHCEAEQRKK